MKGLIVELGKRIGVMLSTEDVDALKSVPCSEALDALLAGMRQADDFDPDGKITDHFAWKEFRSSPSKTDVPYDQRDEVLELCEQLEVIREAVNRQWPTSSPRGLQIHSGYRTKQDNAASNGAKGSQHLLGTAADIYVTGEPVDAHDLESLIVDLMDAGKITAGGHHAYTHRDGKPRKHPFVHYDIRGYEATW